MATGNDTKATQTEEEEEDYSHLTEKDVSFKCPEGIKAKLHSFEVIPKRGFLVGLKLDGKLYNGIFLEAIDSFAPVNPNTTKRRRPIFYKKNKTRPSGVTRTKKPNAFSRENFPKGYIDTYNTIEARLRYGRDKKIPGFNSLEAIVDSPCQSKDDSILKSSRKKKSQSAVAGSTSNTGSPISSVKSKLNKSQSVVAGSASNTDSSISSVKRNRNKKSRSVVAGSASNTDSSISSASKCKTKRKYLKRNENDNVPEKTSNENSSPCSIFISITHDGGTSEASSDTSFCSSVTKMTSKNDEKQIKVNFMRSGKAMKSQPHDLNSGPGCMVSTPRTNTDALSMNIDDTLQSVTSSQDSLSRMSEPDLIAFSPEINTKKQCRKGHESVESVSISSQLSEPDLISFSPEINNETNCKTKVIERPSVIKRTGLNLLFSPLSEFSCRTSETVSSQFFHEELYKSEKLGDDQFIEDGDNILNTNEKSVNQFTKSKLQNTAGMKDVSVNNLILNKITLNKGNSSSEPELQYKSNVDEIQGTNSSFETKTLNEVNPHVKCSESREEIIGVNSDEIFRQNKNLEFESNEKNNTADQKNKQIFACGMPTSYQYISQNSQKDERIRSRSDKTNKSTVMKMDPLQLSELKLPENPEIQCTNDNTDLKEISRQFPFQICFKSETLNSSKNKENKFDISKIAAQSGISSKYSSRQMPDCKLKNFQRDITMELGYNSDVLAVANSRSKSQPSFESVKLVSEEDTNVLPRVQKEVDNSQGSGLAIPARFSSSLSWMTD